MHTQTSLAQSAFNVSASSVRGAFHTNGLPCLDDIRLHVMSADRHLFPSLSAILDVLHAGPSIPQFLLGFEGKVLVTR